MPLYVYRCEECGEELTLEMTFAQHDAYRKLPPAIHGPCFDEGYRADFQQVLGFAFHRSMPEHYNHSLDRYVSNERDVNDELKRQSDAMSARMGFDHRYELVDPHDPAAVGVTDEGLEATERAHRDSGEEDATSRTFI